MKEINKQDIEKSNSWPIVEAKKILKERKSFIEKKGWPSFLESIKILHNPLNETDLGRHELAKSRLIFDEFFAHQFC